MAAMIVKGEGERGATVVVPLVDFESMRVKGWVDQGSKDWADLCRLTTLVMPVCCTSGEIAVKLHPRGSPSEGRRDFFGREVCLEKETVAFLLGPPLDIGSLFLSAAIRTVHDELRLENDRGVPELFSSESAHEYLFHVGDVGSFTWKRERRTTLFLLRIPDGSSIFAMAEVRGRFVRVETEFHPLETILKGYADHTWPFAEGSEQVLRRLQEDENLLQAVQSRIKEIR
jgi:hypothetical protein